MSCSSRCRNQKVEEKIKGIQKTEVAYGHDKIDVKHILEDHHIEGCRNGVRTAERTASVSPQSNEYKARFDSS